MNEFYDVVSIGSSPKIFMKLFEYAKEGKKILILDSDSNLGGNWKTTDFASCKGVEYGCFVIPNNKVDYDFLINEIKIDMPISEYQPFTFYRNKKYPLNSELLYALLDYRKNKSFKNSFNIFISYFKEKYKSYKGDYVTRYFKKGIPGLIEKYNEIIKDYNINVYYKEKVNNIFVNFKEEIVYLESEKFKIKTPQVLIGSGINIEKIQSDKFDFFISRNQNVLNLFTFVHLKIKSNKKAEYSYVDLTHIDGNELEGKLLEKVDFFQETRTSYDKFKVIWRLTNISDFATNLKEDEILLSVDTNGWLPKKDQEIEMVNIILDILKKQGLLLSDVELLEFNWNKNEARTIGGLEKLITDYYSPYLLSTNSLFFTRNPRGK